MQTYSVVIKGKGLYEPLLLSYSAAHRSKLEAQQLYPTCQVIITTDYSPLPLIKKATP